jgi:uncharacterized protein YPO0396
LQGITLLSVIAMGFAAGIWQGQIDTRLEDLQRAREEQKGDLQRTREEQSAELKELAQQVADIGKSISYLQGSLQGANVPAQSHKPQR